MFLFLLRSSFFVTKIELINDLEVECMTNFHSEKVTLSSTVKKLKELHREMYGL
jgi:hypothetical protein